MRGNSRWQRIRPLHLYVHTKSVLKRDIIILYNYMCMTRCGMLDLMHCDITFKQTTRILNRAYYIVRVLFYADIIDIATTQLSNVLESH